MTFMGLVKKKNNMTTITFFSYIIIKNGDSIKKKFYRVTYVDPERLSVYILISWSG